MNLAILQNFLQTLLSPYNIDEKWYPFILIGIAVIFLLLVYVIFAYIRAFISWITGINEFIAEQKYQNSLLEEMIALQKEQLDLMQVLFIENNEEDVLEEGTEEEFEEKKLEETSPKIPEKNIQKRKGEIIEIFDDEDDDVGVEIFDDEEPKKLQKNSKK